VALLFPFLATGEGETSGCDFIVEEFFEFVEVPPFISALSQQYLADVVGMEDSDGVDTRKFTVDDITVLSKLVEKPHWLLDVLVGISQHRETIRARWKLVDSTIRT
jgi:hypothetical protein